MTTRFCQTIKAIVAAAGQAERFAQRGQHFRLRIENPPYLPLTIEAWDSPIAGEGRRISVAHYFEQEGDLVPDREVEIRDDGWPIELSQQTFYTQVTTYSEDGRTMTFAPQSKREVLCFLNNTWAPNLPMSNAPRERWWAAWRRAQRFIDAARQLAASAEVSP
jgi:hypothetical protein